MPCLIRVLARLQDPQTARGANQSAIDSLRLITISAEDLGRENASTTCPICITEMAVGEQARILPCKHFFHKTVKFFPIYSFRNFDISNFLVC